MFDIGASNHCAFNTVKIFEVTPTGDQIISNTYCRGVISYDIKTESKLCNLNNKQVIRSTFSIWGIRKVLFLKASRFYSALFETFPPRRNFSQLFPFW